MFHQPVAALIKESTIISSARCSGGEVILPPSDLGSQASPILQDDPLSIKSLDQRILFHAKELKERFASKIEQFGIYFALKTL